LQSRYYLAAPASNTTACSYMFINARTKEGLTPLRIAAQFGHKDVAELLLAKGADVNTKDEDGYTPLHFTAARPDIADLLRRHGVRK
jgi:ankyrin repeat protein